MKKEISLRKVIETLSAHDNRAEDARLISIHTMELADGMNHVFRIRHADGFIREVRIPLYEEIEKPILTKEEAVKRHRIVWPSEHYMNCTGGGLFKKRSLTAPIDYEKGR